MAQSEQPPAGAGRPGQPAQPRPGQPGQPPQRPGQPPQAGQDQAVPSAGAAAGQQQAPPSAGSPAAQQARAQNGNGGQQLPPVSGGRWMPPGVIPPVQHGIEMLSGPGGFQRQVYYQPAVAVEGDFCDHNPRTTVDAGPGGLVAGQPGVMVGRFAWFDPDSPLDPNEAPKIVLSFTATPQPVVGFVHREQQGLIVNWLGGASMWVPPGFMITLHQTGGFFVRNAGDDRCELGMKAFANTEDGTIGFGAAGGGGPGGGGTWVETKWFATSAGDPGLLIKMSSWPLG